ncbi:MAG: site-2 protease family protein [Candidatus Latescibacteria bacterium]|jgi:membrane-associated protease RseP (regulator of RpoE activity)|nr:site-2 protease family protein [Candidatus Latescibacterota bacterium]
MQYRKTIIQPTDGYYKDISESSIPKKKSGHINLFLFIATVFTTTAVGAVIADKNPFESLGSFLNGLPFSVTLLSILGIHEFAHYFTAKLWKIRVTLPYFIPAPILPLGTFGAVIKMKSSIPTRKALIDMGTSGPIAGFIIAVIATIIGLSLSKVVPAGTLESETYYILGESLLFRFLSFIVLGPVNDNYAVIPHPVAFAGWIGLFVTALNLIPIGQLDGGHILFALSPKTHELVRRIRFPLLLLMGLTFWNGWYLWAVLSLFFGRRHPYPDRMEPSIGIFRMAAAIITIIIFFICITPTPISIG